MKILTVVSHPRVHSLTFAVTARFTQGLADAGHETEVLDLHRSGFNPVLWEADEPDWSSDHKIYSPEVEAEIERMKKYDALAYIFPIWWYGLPAMLKGYIDRVWNNGFAYGSNKLHHKQLLWLGLAAAPKEHFEKRQYDKMMAQQLNVGMAEYVGISNSKVEILYDTLDSRPEIHERLLQQAYFLGLYYDHSKAVTL
ncbi:NAD(P)H oxidoreductase [Paenibacillus allorhizosphaerae]|uniref:Glutathione-regulated potassium-efflux system ancillary protein KefF n=1 Tax=Paenibacillus allorhizosphaerae TaxID=2849866 RepID=A0ABM8VR43_9BACL|nr:NAD(P)H oxidoreductase [Paenibacillus allorhizosphaerae]CAG7654899.1 Glutathione-regulated potassium-efflux system ancillary protein KefF [Paenibacillus allorhizosphaerae]